jgi:hypothetical protein
MKRREAKTLSVAQLKNSAADPDLIISDLELVVDEAVGPSERIGVERPDGLLRLLSLIQSAEDVNVRDLIMDKIIDYAYVQTGHYQTCREQYIRSLFDGPQE